MIFTRVVFEKQLFPLEKRYFFAIVTFFPGRPGALPADDDGGTAAPYSRRSSNQPGSGHHRNLTPAAEHGDGM